MVSKSKLITFILSFIPGVGHIYLGLVRRGFALFGAAFVATFIAVLIVNTRWGPHSPGLVLLTFALFWLMAVVDAVGMVDKINMELSAMLKDGRRGSEEIVVSINNREDVIKDNKKMIAMFLSIIPGVGHLYLGLRRLGIQLMLSFFLTFYLSDWLRFGGFLILMPIIWFFGMFDVMHKVDESKEMQDEDLLELLNLTSFVKERKQVLAWILIVFGLLTLLTRVAFPLINTYVYVRGGLSNYLYTGIVALILLGVGYRLLSQSRSIKVEE